jgi:hypothetical protein
MHKFTVIIDGELKTFSNYDDIPENFDHVIEFLPEIPKGPHTQEQHDEIEEWNNKFRKLMEIEYARSNTNW